MAVEIREVVLQARVMDDKPVRSDKDTDVCALKAQILAECKQIVRDALERRQAR